MIVYGSKDLNLGLQSVNNLRNMPRSEIIRQEGAGHASEEEKPQEFHFYMYNFLRGIERDQV